MFVVAVSWVAVDCPLATLSLHFTCDCVCGIASASVTERRMLPHYCKVEPIEDALRYLEDVSAKCNLIMAANEFHDDLVLPDMPKVAGH